MISEIIQAFILIFIAEMGDKTQILAMAFATKYPVRKVLIGIGLGSFINHGLAVLLGSYLSTLVPINTIQMIAGFAFVGFAIWSLKAEDEDTEDEPKFQFGPVATVSLAFFLGELGDKTQLTAITLTADATFPGMILVGTVAGMVATGGLGIIVGKKMGDKIPELGIKLVASLVFMFFGFQKLSQTLPKQYMTARYMVSFIVVVTIIVAYLVYKLLIMRKKGIQTAYVRQSRLLYDYTLHIMEDLNSICVGPEICGECKKNQCAVGYAKMIIKEYKDSKTVISGVSKTTDRSKPFSEDKVIDSLVDTLILINDVNKEEELKVVHEVRKQLEGILLGYQLEDYHSFDDYIANVKAKENMLGQKILYQYKVRKGTSDRILNLGSKTSNIYLLTIPEGYALIDTGYRETYTNFKQNLYKYGIPLNDIKYVFLTHVHDDHVGCLNQVLEETEAKVILTEESARRLKIGQNSFDGGCSSIRAWLFCQILKLFGKGQHKFEPVDQEDRYLVIDDNNSSDIEKKLTGRVVDLPGHTADSIGLLIDNDILFCGDASMNGLPSRHNIIIWIENLTQYKTSWKKMMDMTFNTLYPSHGVPFDKSLLSRNEKQLNKINLYRL